MKRVIVNVIVLFAVGGAATYLLLGGGSVSRRALAAYQAGDYSKALPLYKQWGEMPDVRNNPQQRQVVMSYIREIEQRMSGPAVLARTSQASAAQGQPVRGAMTYVLEQKKALTDPTTGVDRVLHEPMAPNEVRTMTIKQLGNFEFDSAVDKVVPDDVLALSGGRVKLNGFMIPLTQAGRVSEFSLVPSLQACCFGQPPGMQHTITVRMDPGKAAEYVIDEVEVEGVLHVDVKQEDGYTTSIFELAGQSVKVMK